MKHDDLPIGVFDSGIGGLPCLEKFINHFPKEDFIYIADTLHCPYGIREKDDIRNIVKATGQKLIDQKVKLILIACNTATINDDLLVNSSPVPIIGTLEATAAVAVKISNKGNILVLGTKATIESNKYQMELEKDINGRKHNIYAVPLSEAVPLVEEGTLSGPKLDKLLESKFKDLLDKDIDTVIMGCTHFEYIKDEILKYFPGAKGVCSGDAMSEVAERLMENKEMFSSHTKHGKLTLETTGDLDLFKKQSSWFPYKVDEYKKI